MSKYGYHDQKDKIIKRLNRAEGQVRGIGRMVNDDKYCIDILTQITAVQAALDKIGLQLLAEHTKHCMVDSRVGPKSLDAKTDEVIKAVGRMISR